MTYRSNAGRGRAAQVARPRRAVAQAAAREAAAKVAAIPGAALRTAELFCLGYPPERIAVKRALTLDTVRAHLRQARTALGVEANAGILDYQELIEDRLTARVSTP